MFAQHYNWGPMIPGASAITDQRGGGPPELPHQLQADPLAIEWWSGRRAVHVGSQDRVHRVNLKRDLADPLDRPAPAKFVSKLQVPTARTCSQCWLSYADL